MPHEKTLIVTGMHRSATSLVAMGLHSVCPLGDDLIGPGPGNPLGHFEDRQIVLLNERILASAGGAWHRPPSEAAILEQTPTYAPQIAELVHHRNQHAPIWGAKDPRFCLTARLWHAHLRNPIYVPCFRRVADVALSLTKRNNLPINRAGDLARVYNARLLAFLADVVGSPQ